MQELNPEKATELEYAWWIEHRKNGYYEPTPKLIKLLEDQAVEIYLVDRKKANIYAKNRALAMCLRHKESNDGVVTDKEWTKIEKLVEKAWAALQA